MIVGVDIGGTFTDVVCVDRATKRIYLTKTITNHASIVDSVIAGLAKILKLVEVSPSEVERIVLGTTIATNVVVQRRGARMSVFTTEGFEDVLEIGRLKRRSMYDLNIDVQTPVFLSPKRLRVGVPERVDAHGEVVRALDEDFVARKIVEVRETQAIEAVAVVYLFSFENNAHELRTREIIKRIFPDMYVSLSCEVNPVYREYERTVVTAFDAYMRPVVERGISNMEQRLRAFGIEGEIHVMQSRGGVTTTRNAASRPVNLFLSGPAGGVVGGSRLARLSGVADAVTIDIGGTSCDVAVIAGGVPAIRTEGEIDGYPVRVPMVDINTIGAGGGSLLRVDASGIMRVGPASAGSEPGPVCYRRGGSEPTVTDASVVLGYLNPESFAGGDFQLDVDAAHRALEGIGASLGMSVVQAALGAHRIMNVQMAEQIRLITVKRGYDPRLFTLIAFGGAGPLHAGVLMSMLGMKECLIPATPGVLSAYGLLNADIEVEHSESFLKRADAIGADHLTTAFGALEAHCREIMRRDGLALGSVLARYSADMRYTGQSYEIPIPLADTRINDDTVTQMVADFEQQYQKMYGHTNRTAVEIVNLRCVTYEPVELLEGMHIQTPGQGAGRKKSDRRIQFLGGEATAAVLVRDDLSPGDRIEGPVVIEQADTTILIYPQQQAVVDDQSNLRITGVSEAYVL
jgi:N-methylhydantoinase A/oxoprolinase/acetone carboxylase beta subunit